MPRKTDTDGRHVHAALAAAVADPCVLERLHRTGEAGSPFDFERIRLFAGLALKVRHNDIRMLLPLTFKLLDRLKISVPLFAAYGKSAAALRLAGRTTRSDKLEVMSGFIEGWLRADDPMHALVRDALHHERALLTLEDRRANAPAGADDDATPATHAVTPAAVPRPAAGLIRTKMSCHPLQLAATLGSPKGDLTALHRGQFQFVYRWDALKGCAAAIEIDELGNLLLELADGRESFVHLVSMLRRAGLALTSAQLCRAGQQLLDHDLLAVRAPRPRRRVRHAAGSR
ncbi:RiPP maturation protein ApyI [Bradyrhizobium diazoefficiens]|uniref:RiPP maturation protein ApyI n=1 Tax=Bradyrhizobium diazoefficiens TaxID=1355477 RepID=UPI001B76E836|nr:hypothetical protein [Bradyrhizobium japonicum]